MNIPHGVEDGTRIRLAGEGEAGVRGGPPGDLYIFLSMAAHPFFQREGADLHCRVPISMVTAAMGGDIEVPTIDGGKSKVKIPEGAQSGRRFRLQAKGMPVLRQRHYGDLYVQVVVETPQKLTKKQRELLAEFHRLSSTDTQPESSGFLGKVKEFLDGLGGREARLGRPKVERPLAIWPLSSKCFKSGKNLSRAFRPCTFALHSPRSPVLGCHVAAGPTKIRTQDRTAAAPPRGRQDPH